MKIIVFDPLFELLGSNTKGNLRDGVVGVISSVVSYNPQIVPPYLQMVLSGNADAQTRKDFQNAWQERVENILAAFNDNPNLVTCKQQ